MASKIAVVGENALVGENAVAGTEILNIVETLP